MVRQFKVDFGIIGISGIELDGNLFDYDLHEVRVAQVIIEHSRQVYLAADHSKIGRNALVELGDFSQVRGWLTDRESPTPLAGVLTETGNRIHVSTAN